MYTLLLAPLDRSPVAEQALPFAVAIAARARASLELVAVHHSYVLDDQHAANAWALKPDPAREAEISRQEQNYLSDAARRVTLGTQVHASGAVLFGSAVDPWAIAERILEQVRLRHADLIVMTTRVRGLASRIGLGSVADQLVRQSHIPILLIHPDDRTPLKPPTPVLDNFLIALDGSAFSEQILTASLALARIMSARATLLRVVAPKGGVQEAQHAEQYLEQLAAAPREQGLQIQTRVVASSHPGEAILHEAQAGNRNLIALATHGYGGFKRLILGSVADRIIRHSEMPVLVHCPQPKD